MIFKFLFGKQTSHESKNLKSLQQINANYLMTENKLENAHKVRKRNTRSSDYNRNRITSIRVALSLILIDPQSCLLSARSN